MLKLLYSTNSPMEELCRELSMTRQSVEAEIRRLEEKVRMYLITAEKRQSNARVRA